MMSRPVRYAIVTPARDEAAYIEQTLRSVSSQTVPPTVWVIADDGSTDATPELVERYAARHQFIRLVRLGARRYGSGADRLSWGTDAVVFNLGLDTLDPREYDYIIKLDGDLRFGPDYFERLFREFDQDPRLGIAGGHCYEERGGRLVMERVPDWHVRGATKVYRRQCFEDIGGVENLLAWDGVDEARAQLRGWYSRAFADPGIVHLRPQGASGGGILRGRMRLGIGSYVIRYHPVFVVARACKLAAKRPYVVGGVAYVAGYLKAAWMRPRRLEDPETVEFIRRAQLTRLAGRTPYTFEPARAAENHAFGERA
jgi:glycosyltransferase involved in cell wall biosynthesis